MVDFNRVEIYLILTLLFAVTQLESEFIARVGVDMTLPCENGKYFSDGCQSVTWLLRSSGNNLTVTLFECGQIHRDTGSKSDRLTVTDNCSLVIKKVTSEDGGLYICRHFNESQKQITNSWITLSVNREEPAKKTTTATGVAKPKSVRRRVRTTTSKTAKSDPATDESTNTGEDKTTTATTILTMTTKATTPTSTAATTSTVDEAEVTCKNSNFFVRVGDKVTLPCKNRKNFYDNCTSTTWIFSDWERSATVALFEDGMIHKDAGEKSDRLSITANCSLVIKNITPEDDGQYTCRQFRSGRQVTEYWADLSIINRENRTMAIKLGSTISPARAAKTTESTTVTEESTGTGCQIKIILVSVGLAALSVTTVCVDIWARRKAYKTPQDKTDQNDPDVVIYEIIEDLAASV